MAEHDIEGIRRRAEAVRRQYDAHFAGQPRITRELGLMEGLLRELDETIEAAVTLGPADGADLVAELRETRTLYANEAEAIRAAQAEGPDAVEAHRLATWAAFEAARYRRHFAGRGRATRDVGLLGEMIASLERLEREMNDLAAEYENDELRRARQTTADNLSLYRSERTAIVAARGAGTLDEQASTLASVANEQFELYRHHFAGKPRVSRRPAVMERMVRNLEQTLDRMKALQAQGLHAEHNGRNIGIVEERLDAWRKELEAIRQAKQQSSLQDLVSALGKAANEVMAAYREQFAGQDRATRDLDLLRRLADALYDLGRQMDDLDRVREEPNNQHNLAVVLDQLRLFDREDALIREAQQQ